MSDSEIDSLLGSIKGLKLDASQQNIEFELDKKIDEFIKILFPYYKGTFNTTDDKLKFLKDQNPVDRSKIEKDKLKNFLTGYHRELDSVLSNAPPVVESPPVVQGAVSVTIQMAWYKAKGGELGGNVPVTFIKEDDMWVLQQPKDHPMESVDGATILKDVNNAYAELKTGFPPLHKLVIKKSQGINEFIYDETVSQTPAPAPAVPSSAPAPAPAPTLSSSSAPAPAVPSSAPAPAPAVPSSAAAAATAAAAAAAVPSSAPAVPSSAPAVPSSAAAAATAAAVSEKPDEFGSFDGTFHETQQNAGCGRHALNNLLGGTFFTSPTTEDAFKNTNPYTLVELKTAIGILNENDPLDLQKLCKCLNAIYPVKYCPSVDNGINCCQVAENYDQMVLRTALELIGFDVVPGGQGAVFGKDSKKFNSSDLDGNITGILINPGGHWTSARKHKGKIYHMNSINTNPQESQSSNKIITPSDLNDILKDTIVLVVGPYIVNSGKKDFIRLKIESIGKDMTDENVTIAGESEERSIRGLMYDDLPLIIDDITDVKLINILYENEIYIKAPYTDLANYIVLFGNHTDKTKMQADLVKLLTTP